MSIGNKDHKRKPDEDGLEVEEPYSSDEEEVQQPFDPTKIDIITERRTIDSLLSRLRYGELDLAPDFQRQGNLWNDMRKTSLIESLLLRIPIPSFYVAEDKEGNYAVVDGLQRLCAIAHFVDVEALNKAVDDHHKPLVLHENGLKSLSNLKGKIYTELDRPLARRIIETELTIHVIRASTPGNVKFNIFSRINQGGLPLTSQEIRNAIYPGIWRDQIKKLAGSEIFLDATERKIPSKRMENIELILRAIALYDTDSPRPNDQNLDDFLNKFVEEKCRYWNEQKWEEIEFYFNQAIKASLSIFGEYSFRKFYPPNDKRKPINRGLFEAEISSLMRANKEKINLLIENKASILDKFIALSDKTYYKDKESISADFLVSPNTRFHEVDRIFDDALNQATSKGLGANNRIKIINYLFDIKTENTVSEVFIDSNSYADLII